MEDILETHQQVLNLGIDNKLMNLLHHDNYRPGLRMISIECLKFSRDGHSLYINVLCLCY